MDVDKPSRERFEAALALKGHDRVPVQEFIIDAVNRPVLLDRAVRGYAAHSSHSIVDSIPHENFLAMVDEARTYGRYC